MQPIKYAVLLLAALMAFSGTVEARRGSTSQRKRDKEREAQRQREKYKQNLEKYKKQQEKLAEARKKRIAAAEAAEREQRDKANEARRKKVEEQIVAEKAARAEQALLGEYHTMAKEVRMSSTQRAKLVAMVRKFQGLPPGATQDKTGELARLQRAFDAATGKKKKILGAKLIEVKKRGAATSKRASKPSGLSKDNQHRQIMALLTPVQKLKWGGYKLAQDPTLKFTGIELTEKQLKRIRVICDEAAKGLSDETGKTPPTIVASTRKLVLKKVRMQIIYEVLTPAQRTIAKRS
jgi:hypothetical protein